MKIKLAGADRPGQLSVRAILESQVDDRDVLAASAKTAGNVVQTADAVLLGLGAGLSKDCTMAGRRFVNALASAKTSDATVDLSAIANDERKLFAFVRGCHLATYVLAQWRDERAEEKATNLTLSVRTTLPNGKAEHVLAKAAAISTGQLAAMHLVDRPANAKKPADVAKYVEQLGDKHGFAVETLDEEALEIQGFTGILAVGRGSDHPPRLLKLHYKGGDAIHLGLVGKGITFDTGGISIKGSQNMAFMKSDLGGAAAVLGTFMACAELKLPIELHGLLAVAENAISGDAYLPSDVIRNYSGKTIEITDTDAEGRIVMADALAYMPEWANPSITFDVATLTGSAVRTFGYECAAVFCNNEQLTAQLREAGDTVDERLWPLPLWEAYEADLKSDVADIKHFHGKPIAGAINAAKFLEYFASDKQQWAHLDIAGVAFGANEFAKDRSATGYGVGLLTEFLINQSDAV